MATTAPPTFLTVADLLERLGDVPPHPVRLRPAPGEATEQDVLDIEAREGRLCELVDGVLVEKGMGYYESRLAMLLGFFLQSFVLPRDLGIVTGESGIMKLFPGHVRIPDLAFVSWVRHPERSSHRPP